MLTCPILYNELDKENPFEMGCHDFLNHDFDLARSYMESFFFFFFFF